MMYHTPNALVSTLEEIVATPLHATLAVGISILVLQALIHRLASFWPPVVYVHYVIPFVPPYIITRTAKRISERKCLLCKEPPHHEP